MATTPTPMSNTTLKDLKTLVLKEWGKKWNEPTWCYEFSNGRKFYRKTEDAAIYVTSPDF